jgi:hypothetical protein
MTAGSGIAHSERFEDPSALSGGLEMIQTWVALPEKDEENAPAFNNYTPEQLPVYTDKGVWMRLIAGDAYGLRNEVKTNSPFILPSCCPPGRRKICTSKRTFGKRVSILLPGVLNFPGLYMVPGKCWYSAREWIRYPGERTYHAHAFGRRAFG